MTNLLRFRCRTLIRAFLCSIGSLTFALALHAASATKSFNIPAGDAALTLKQFGEQSGLSIMFAPDKVKGIETKSVSGDLSPQEALERLLANTPLYATATKEAGGYSIRRGSAPESKNGQRAIAANQSDRPEKIDARYETDASGQKILKLDTFEVFGRKTLNMDIQRTRDDAQPYVTFNRDTITRSGALDVGSFLNSRLTMSMSAQSPDQGLAGTVAGTNSAINLRGLGTDETLILIDGRRMAGFQGAQPDVNSIPLASIERIEVLPATASGIYGGGATGGVINIILRRDYAGTEVKLTYANTFDTDVATRRIDFSAGTTFEGGKSNLMVTGFWSDANDLLVRDRDFGERARALALANNPNLFFGSGVIFGAATANILSQTGAPLTLKGSNTPLNSPRTFVPAGYAGPASDNGAALLANAGKYNLAPTEGLNGYGVPGGLGRASTILTAPERASFSATYRRTFSERFDLHAEYSASESKGRINTGSGGAIVTVPGSVASNPFNETVQVYIPVPNSDNASESVTKTMRTGLGALLKLPHDWTTAWDYTLSRSTYASTDRAGGSFDSTGVTNAVTNGAINPFKDLYAFPFDASPFTPAPNEQAIPFRNTLHNASLRAGGTLPVSLPGGPIAVSFLVEGRWEISGERLTIRHSTVTSTTRSYTPEQKLNARSGYLEAAFPILAAKNRVPLVEELELRVAARSDRYVNHSTNLVNLDANLQPITTIIPTTNRGESIDPTFSLKYVPLEGILFRASYGTGYLTPSLGLLGPPSTLPLSGWGSLGLRDPLRGNELVQAFNLKAGGNPDIRPEKSESKSVGLVLSSKRLLNGRLSVDWVKTEKRDNIQSMNFAFSSAAFLQGLQFAPERFTRGPASDGFSVGPITTIDQSVLNIARLDVESLDLNLQLSRETESVGKFQFEANATRLLSLQTQFLPVTPVDENLGVGPNVTLGGGLAGQSAALKWRANATLTWIRGPWTAGWTTRYFGPYYLNLAHSINVTQGSATVPSQTYHDVFVAYDFGAAPRFGGRWFSNTGIQLGVNNVFNHAPPLDLVGAGGSLQGYSLLGDPRLANYYISVRKSF